MTARDDLLARAIEHLSRAGISDASLRRIATELGTSHRMLIYHFDSRDGLLAAVVAEVERQQRELLATMISTEEPAVEQSLGFWRSTVEAAQRHGRLFFELAAHAMQDRPHARSLRRSLIDPWLPPLEQLCGRLGLPPEECPPTARMLMATARGLLFDLLLTGDREAVDGTAEQLHVLLLARVGSHQPEESR